MRCQRDRRFVHRVEGVLVIVNQTERKRYALSSQLRRASGTSSVISWYVSNALPETRPETRSTFNTFVTLAEESAFHRKDGWRWKGVQMGIVRC